MRGRPSRISLRSCGLRSLSLHPVPAANETPSGLTGKFPIAQFPAEDFAYVGFRERVQKLDGSRCLVCGHFLATVRDQFLSSQRGRGPALAGGWRFRLTSVLPPEPNSYASGGWRAGKSANPMIQNITAHKGRVGSSTADLTLGPWMSALPPGNRHQGPPVQCPFGAKSEVGIIRPVPGCSHSPRVVSGPRQLEARSLPSGRGPRRSI
jgi:hypothetical protein